MQRQTEKETKDYGCHNNRKRTLAGTDRPHQENRKVREESTNTITYEDSDLWVDNCQAIRLLCVSGRTLQQYRTDGKLDYKRFGRQVWYRLSDIEAFAGVTMRPLSQKNLIAIRKECIEKNRDILSRKED